MGTFKTGWIILGMLLLAACLGAGEDWVDTLTARQAGLKRLRVVFTMDTSRPANADDEMVHYEGELTAILPERYDLILRRPKENPGWVNRFVADGVQRLEVERLSADDEPTSKRQRLDPEDDLFRKILDSVRADPAALRRDFRVEAAGEAEAPLLRLTPILPSIARQVRGIEIRLNRGLDVQRIIIDETGGLRRLVDIQVFERDPDLDAGRFVIPVDDQAR